MPRQVIHKYVVRPSVQYIERSGRLMLNTEEMAEFLGVPTPHIHNLNNSGRIPLPFRLGLGKCVRWSVYELLEWVEADCPRRTEWIKMRGRTGWYPLWRR